MHRSTVAHCRCDKVIDQATTAQNVDGRFLRNPSGLKNWA